MVVQDGSPRILLMDGIGLEAPLEGTLLLTRNRDVPGVIGKIGTALGNLGVNIATFAPRSGENRKEGALSGTSLWCGSTEMWMALWCSRFGAIPSITEAKLIRLPEAAKPQGRTA